jgi:hypothetical protein
VTEADLRAWMDAYTAAFNAQDSQAAANLFTEEGTYQWGPFGELLVGATRSAEPGTSTPIRTRSPR